MDDLDFSILRQLVHPQTFQWNVRLSYAEVARAVSADEETVRMRVRRLQDEGVISSWEVGVHPALLGREMARLDLPPVPPESREKVAAALEALDGARILFEYYGGRFAVVVFQEPGPPLQRQATLLGAIAGAPARVTPFPLPPPSVELDRVDWRVVRALRADPRAPYAALAERLGASEKTLRRRLDRMIRGRTLFLNPDVDFSRVKGVLPCMVRVVHGEGSPRRELEEALRGLPRIVFPWFEESEARVSFVAASLPEVEDVRRRLDALAAGRARVELDLTMRRANVTAWLDEQVARRAA